MNPAYIPIDCSRHDELLALATLRTPCVLEVDGPDGDPVTTDGVIEDVFTAAGAEYLRMRDGPTVRLDHIRMLNGKPFP
jgi:transcriptional antiterminator Rof (Rho-off)